MIVRRVATAAATMIVAICVALAVPVSQLTTVTVSHSCCCPDPDDCHCPREKPDHSKQPSMKSCHQQNHLSVAPQLPSFVPPALAVATPVPVTAALPLVALAQPHAPPAPQRPAAPS